MCVGVGRALVDSGGGREGTIVDRGGYERRVRNLLSLTHNVDDPEEEARIREKGEEAPILVVLRGQAAGQVVVHRLYGACVHRITVIMTPQES